MNGWLGTLTLSVALLVAGACGGEEAGPAPAPSGGTVASGGTGGTGGTGGNDLVVDYPLEGSVFPPDFVAPTFLWHDDAEGVDHWQVTIAFADGGEDRTVRVAGGPPPAGEIDPRAIHKNNKVYEGTEYQNSADAWTLDEETWAEVRRRAVDRPATFTITGRGAGEPGRELSRGAVTLSISSDPVGAPIFYRDVPLMPAVGKKGTIQPIAPDALPLIAWRLKDVSKPDSRLLLTNMPSCANCHSFSDDGLTMGMDVDGPDGDKGAYMIKPVAPEMVVEDADVITWNDFEDKPEGHKTLGFLSRVSPEGKYVVTTLNESLYVSNFAKHEFVQVFYPTRGILAWYSTESGEMKALPGADDPEYVHCDPAWSPDGNTLVFARAAAFDAYGSGQELAEYPNDPKEPRIRYDLYRMPFNEGRGGTPVPIEGASANGMSNTFPKVSPDGKWVVYTKCENGQLMRPDGKLWIVPLEGGEAREMSCNTTLMNSWHSFSPNGRWLVWSSKQNTPYTQMFLTHLDEDGNDTPAILIPNATAANRAVNIPEFLNASSDAIRHIDMPAVAHHELFRRGLELVEEERYEEVIPLARQALEKEPDFHRARRMLGWALVKTGKIEEGLREFDHVIRLDPKDSAAHFHRGLTLNSLGRAGDALRCFELAVHHGPRNLEAWKSLGHARSRRGDITGALEAYATAVELAPLDSVARESLAVVLLDLGRPGEALQHLAEVCRLAPEDADTRLYVAWQLATHADAAVRDGAQAVSVAEQARKLLTGDQPFMLDVLAASYAEAGRFKEAVATAREAVQVARRVGLPATPEIESRLSLYEQGRPYRQR